MTSPRGWGTISRRVYEMQVGVTRAASQVASRGSRGVGTWGRASAAPRPRRLAPDAKLALPRPPPSPGSRIRARLLPAQPSLRRPRLAFRAAAALALPPRRAPAVHSSCLGVGVGNSWGAPGKRVLGREGTQQGGL